ncbi:iron ABC transporter permease [Amphritea sp. 2_MG-2023]|uniref:ABC transporter permease n=1 Tax=Amphritea TaxID=515417 RepID=UPI001C076923|nr:MULTISPECIES: iron ABC transporter permease [Amphritea]MBU2965435.1 iron ABC transporter permease [Amphritea atlantica]MDO6420725.1 iron ABC transporter permease [Amphritea sp. 2_MG-2023]MDX2424278.1 iron ABC transporter permease [Amphritea sp.]
MQAEQAIPTIKQAPALMTPQKNYLFGWYSATWGTALMVALPILSVFYLALFPSENIWSHLISTVLPVYITTTLALMLGVGVLSVATGVCGAWLVTMCRFPGRKLFEWALLLPFAVPAYVIAYVYTDLLEYSGPLQIALRELFGWQTARDYWFPDIRTLGGAILMLSMVLYPYVYLLARASFLEQSTTIHDASRTLGCTPFQSFYRVSLPIARPAIAVGLSLVSMEALNDFGTVDYFAVKSMSAGIYDTWLNMSNLGGAAQIASLMMVFVVILISLERLARAKQRQFNSPDRYKILTGYRLSGWRAWGATLLCALPVVTGFFIPVWVLAGYALKHIDQLWTLEFFTYASHSFILSSSAALLTIIIALLLAYSKRLHKKKSLKIAVQFSSLGYAMPGAVLAIGVIIPLAAFDNTIDRLMDQFFGISTGLLLSGTAFAVIFAYVVRFLAVSLGSVDSSLNKITESMDMASRSLGLSPLQTLLKVHLPLIKGGILTAALVVFVDSMKELPATLILRPFNYDTLATYVYQYASDEMLEACSLAALLIVLVGIIPVILLSRTISGTRDSN